jgi:hypothetical protein
VLDPTKGNESKVELGSGSLKNNLNSKKLSTWSIIIAYWQTLHARDKSYKNARYNNFNTTCINTKNKMK